MSDLIERQSAIDAVSSGIITEKDAAFLLVESPYECNSMIKWAVEVLKKLPSVHPEPCKDAVSRQAVINIVNKPVIIKVKEQIEALPSVQPELTDDRAIEHLQSTGWMQNHDKEMYEMGLRERLADDSGSYDSLVPCEDAISRQAAIDKLDPLFESLAIDKIKALPSAQPEIIRCKDCKHYKFADNRAFGMPVKMCKWFGFEDVDDDDFCSRAEMRTDE